MPAVSDRIKRGKYTFQVFQLSHGGPWYAGSEASKGATREAAIQAHMKVARAGDRTYAKAAKAAAKTSAERQAKRQGKTCTLSTCSGALMTPAHERSAKHKNALAWQRHQRGY